MVSVSQHQHVGEEASKSDNQNVGDDVGGIRGRDSNDGIKSDA